MASHPAPAKKKDFHRLQYNIGLPYPNYGIGTDELPILCRCYIGEGIFYVPHQQDIPTLYRNGCFGHSSITERGPVSLTDTDYEKLFYFQKLKDRREKQRETSSAGANGSSKEAASTNSTNGLQPDEVEKLILLPEEVIFLSFGVGCLSIQNSMSDNRLMTYHDVWKSLVQDNPEFPFIYAVYHYFRAKNWVPKSGVQYGGDYVLYKFGPDFYHSTYVVHIVGLPSRPKLTWTELHALERVAINANKNTLLCEVHVPDYFLPLESSPESIFDIKIRETVITRWTPFGPQASEED